MIYVLLILINIKEYREEEHSRLRLLLVTTRIIVNIAKLS